MIIIIFCYKLYSKGEIIAFGNLYIQALFEGIVSDRGILIVGVKFTSRVYGVMTPSRVKQDATDVLMFSQGDKDKPQSNLTRPSFWYFVPFFFFSGASSSSEDLLRRGIAAAVECSHTRSTSQDRLCDGKIMFHHHYTFYPDLPQVIIWYFLTNRTTLVVVTSVLMPTVDCHYSP